MHTKLFENVIKVKFVADNLKLFLTMVCFSFGIFFYFLELLFLNLFLKLFLNFLNLLVFYYFLEPRESISYLIISETLPNIVEEQAGHQMGDFKKASGREDLMRNRCLM